MFCKLCGKEVKEPARMVFGKIPFDSYWNVIDDETGNVIEVCHECLENNEHIVQCVDCKQYFYDENITNTNFLDYHCRICYINYSITYDDILDYEYKPTPLFFGDKKSKNKLFMGIELEMDEGDSTKEMEGFLLNQNKYGYSFFYGKHDGSLTDDQGIEVVSHPATLGFHTTTHYWIDMLNKANELHFKSNDCDCCGIHIHCNRNYFNNIQIQKLDALLNWHSRTFRRFARRNPRHYGTFEPNKSPSMCGINNVDFGRYSALNFGNSQTIEWRIFKGNLKYESIMALFELVQGVSDFIKQDNINFAFICCEDKYAIKKALKEYLENKNFKYLPAYTEMCKVWRDLEDNNTNA